MSVRVVCSCASKSIDSSPNRKDLCSETLQCSRGENASFSKTLISSRVGAVELSICRIFQPCCPIHCNRCVDTAYIPSASLTGRKALWPKVRSEAFTNSFQLPIFRPNGLSRLSVSLVDIARMLKSLNWLFLLSDRGKRYKTVLLLSN